MSNDETFLKHMEKIKHKLQSEQDTADGDFFKLIEKTNEYLRKITPEV